MVENSVVCVRISLPELAVLQSPLRPVERFHDPFVNIASE